LLLAVVCVRVLLANSSGHAFLLPSIYSIVWVSRGFVTFSFAAIVNDLSTIILNMSVNGSRNQGRMDGIWIN
jgi:hypothetical protein